MIIKSYLNNKKLLKNVEGYNTIKSVIRNTKAFQVDHSENQRVV